MYPSQQHVAPFVKEVEWGLGTRRFRKVAAFWAGLSVSSARTVEVTQEADVVPRCRRAGKRAQPHLFTLCLAFRVRNLKKVTARVRIRLG